MSLASMPVLFALFSLTEFVRDMGFVLKIFVLMTIISFILMHLGKGPLSIVLVVSLSYLMLFSPYTWLFEGAYVIMMLLMFGIAGIFIDFFFVFPGFAAGGGRTPEAKMSSAGGVFKRMGTFGMKGKPRIPPPM